MRKKVGSSQKNCETEGIVARDARLARPVRRCTFVEMRHRTIVEARRVSHKTRHFHQTKVCCAAALRLTRRLLWWQHFFECAGRT